MSEITSLNGAPEDEIIPIPPCPTNPEMEEYLKEQKRFFERMSGVSPEIMGGNPTLTSVVMMREKWEK